MAGKTVLKKNIVNKVKRFRKVIEAAGIPVQKMIVFGSQAKGESKHLSDIDIAVISPLFGKDDVSEMQRLFKHTRFVDSRIEPYPLSPKDFKDATSPIVYEIRKYGILVT